MLCSHFHVDSSHLTCSKLNFTLRIMSSKELENANENIKNSKKPFNKKKWREQRYSGKAKVQKWESIRRKQAQKQFHKEFRKAGVNLKSGGGDTKLNETESLSSFKKAQLQYKEIQRIKEEKKKERERIWKERSKAMKAYKEKKALRFKKLSQKTNKGQPLMRTRIELLLEKIQKEYGNCDNQINS